MRLLSVCVPSVCLLCRTEFAVQCHGLYTLRDSTSTSTTAMSSASSGEFGPWTVSAQSSLGFSFPDDASPVNQSLLLEFVTAAFPALTVPFTRPSVQLHRMPGRGANAVLVVTEIFIRESVKFCRIRSR